MAPYLKPSPNHLAWSPPGWRRWAAALADAIFPPVCPGCGMYHPRLKNIATSGDQNAHFRLKSLDSILCGNCVRNFHFIEPPICTICGTQFNNRNDQDHLCGACITSPKIYSLARAMGEYSGPLRKMVHAFKFGDKPDLARKLGALLFDVYAETWERRPIDIIAPIPLHPSRMKKRGYNQALLLIESWPSMLKEMNVSDPKPEVSDQLLTRDRRTAPQTGLTRYDREKNLKSAFKVPKRNLVEGKKVLLVDDVYTTGCTVAECAHTLLKSGAVRVDVLTLSRVI